MKKKISGFTIIEVVLVLGIAGLIFLGVFIALPALQRNARDAQRRDDMVTFMSALKKYQINNRGALPDLGNSGVATVNSVQSDAEANTWAGFYRDYLPATFNDPSGIRYSLYAVWCKNNGAGSPCTSNANAKIQQLANKSAAANEIVVILQASCDGQTITGTANPRKFVVAYPFENGGFYCEND